MQGRWTKKCTMGSLTSSSSSLPRVALWSLWTIWTLMSLFERRVHLLPVGIENKRSFTWHLPDVTFTLKVLFKRGMKRHENRTETAQFSAHKWNKDLNLFDVENWLWPSRPYWPLSSPLPVCLQHRETRVMTQMSRTQPPPTAPPTIINMGRASETRRVMEERHRRWGGEGCQGKERDEMRDGRAQVSVSRIFRSEPKKKEIHSFVLLIPHTSAPI